MPGSRNTVLGSLAAIAASLALFAASAVAAPPDPGPDWMQEGKPSVKYNFVPDPYEGIPIAPGSQGGRANSFSSDSGKRAGQARDASAQKAMTLTRSTQVKAAGGGKFVDLSQLVHRLANGPVDFGANGKTLFRLSASSSGTGATVTFKAYKGGALQAGSEYVVHISGNSPNASTPLVNVGLAAVSKDGSTLEGEFKAPDGQSSRLDAR